MNLKKITPLLKPYPPTILFEKIAGFNNDIMNSESNALVQVHLILNSGIVIEGTPLKSIDSIGILIAHDKSMSYVQIKQIVAIKINTPSQIWETLTDYAYFELSALEIPSILTLKKIQQRFQSYLLKTCKIQLESTFLENKNLTDNEKYQFQEFLKCLEDVITVIAKETIGKEALESIQKINVFSSSKSLTTSRNNNDILIYVNFENKFKTTFFTDLRTTIETNL